MTNSKGQNQILHEKLLQDENFKILLDKYKDYIKLKIFDPIFGKDNDRLYFETTIKFDSESVKAIEEMDEDLKGYGFQIVKDNIKYCQKICHNKEQTDHRIFRLGKICKMCDINSKQYFEDIKTFNKELKGWYCLSRAPEDILLKSTFKNWTSCAEIDLQTEDPIYNINNIKNLDDEKKIYQVLRCYF